MNKSAEEMFEKLGYEKAENNNYFLIYRKPILSYNKEITFDKTDKTFAVRDSFNKVVHKWANSDELEAIYMQYKELGWLDE